MMFSITTMASSMTMPVASDSASIVMLFSAKPNHFMKMNVPTIEVGMASAAMMVTRMFRMKRNTTMLASSPPTMRKEAAKTAIGEKRCDVRGSRGAQHRSHISWIRDTGAGGAAGVDGIG